MYEKLKVPLSFTWEIYGDQNANYNDCFRMFNPLTREEVDKVSAFFLSIRRSYMCLAITALQPTFLSVCAFCVCVCVCVRKRGRERGRECM